MAATTRRSTSSAPTTTVTPPVGRLASWRLHVLLLICFAIVVVIAVRLVDLQVVRSYELASKARLEVETPVLLAPRRGQITDAKGIVLAMDVERQSLFAVPPQVPAERKAEIALLVAGMTGVPAESVLSALRSDRQWVRLARWLEPEVAEQLAALDLPGLRLVYEPMRFYPQGMTAAHVVGAINLNGEGISGIEAFYDRLLRGSEGKIEGEFDPARNPIATSLSRTLPPQNGADLQLTIDPFIQQVAERELKQAIDEQNADGGSILVLDPRTGAILAMANWPFFDPNRWQDYPPEIYGRNPAIGTVYEPGSTFKMITASAALSSGAVTTTTTVDDPGWVVRYGNTLRNFDGAPHGALTLGGMLYYSSNVAALQFNELTGPEVFYRTLTRFGFGQPTGVDLAGEESGIVNFYGSPGYNPLTFLVNAYGQAISVTPLQLVQAAAAIANDGVMMQPYVVQRICRDGDCVQTTPRVAGKPIEPEVARAVREMLVDSANHYAPVIWGPRTGNWSDQWLVPGYRVAAKTGTASIPLPGGGYDPTYTIGSVLGIAPVDDPRFVVLVKIDRPKKDTLGVLTAIPVYYNVVDQLLRYIHLPPDRTLVSPGQP
ncbi:MAG: peptidoglycan glycosyltransferase [Chloroflexus sp.]|uniref:peptidoglycan D,D-transpeptidase FtsI family protein n=1 Tax=Chloroflexus sp. TaxID=1904827 RepID=UPI0021DF2D29|nr:penicillin-binding protein 2 [Chloroflexus sp.]GIV87952.1 MAG: peptidoglycan glycosyltransferase [Chloroflexus sp.]